MLAIHGDLVGSGLDHSLRLSQMRRTRRSDNGDDGRSDEEHLDAHVEQSIDGRNRVVAVQ